MTLDDNCKDPPEKSFDEKDDLYLSDNSEESENSAPPSKRCRLQADESRSSDEDDDWDDNAAAMLDDQFEWKSTTHDSVLLG